MAADKENIQPVIKTWEDIRREYGDLDYDVSFDVERQSDKYIGSVPYNIIEKAIATCKIAQLIDLGYGGIVNDNEWRDSTSKFAICPDSSNRLEIIRIRNGAKHFVAFRDYFKAEEFMSYPQNITLLKQYYII